MRLSDNSNCRGTALYLAGLIKQDRYITHKTAFSYIQSLPSLRSPFVPSLTVFYFDKGGEPFINHMGLLIESHPFSLRHRDGRRGPFISCEPFDDVLKRLYVEGVIYYSLDVENIRVPLGNI